jgi:hypothetical protein
MLASLKFLMFSLLLASLVLLAFPVLLSSLLLLALLRLLAFFAVAGVTAIAVVLAFFSVPDDHDDDLRFVLYNETYM